MFKYCFLCFLVICSAFINIAEAENRSLTMIISNWAPYKGEDLTEGGIAADITRQALKRSGYSVNTINAPWKRALSGTIKGEYDLIPAIWLTPEREEGLYFTDQILNSRIILISLKSYNLKFRHLEDLKGETVGIGLGWAYPEAFMKADYFKREEAPDLEINIRKLIHGRFNVIAGEEFATRYTVNVKFNDWVDLLRYSKVSLKEAPLHVAFSRKVHDYKLITVRFNETLRSMHEDGSYKRIMRKHGVSDFN